MAFRTSDNRRGGWELWGAARHGPRRSDGAHSLQAENARRDRCAPLEEGGAGAPVLSGIRSRCCRVRRAARDLFNRDWLGAGGLDAGRLLWRRVVARADGIDAAHELDHLGGNLEFGGFFGYFVGKYLGHGIGWLAVLLAAGGANLLNAWVQSPAHRSIGASTAVFAALGLLVAYTWRRGFLRDTPWRARIAPIIAGLGLLAFTGTSGENTVSRESVRLIAASPPGPRRTLRTRPQPQSTRVQRVCGASPPSY